jgi:hypothetical protein
MLTIFKNKRGNSKVVELTPKIARKIAEKVKPKPTSYTDCLIDIESRANRGYTWTYMLRVGEDVIIKLQEHGWNVEKTSKNSPNNSHLVRITW